MRSVVLLLPALLAVGCASPAAEASLAVATVTFEDFFGKPLVDVAIDGNGPHSFILDTGADVTVIDRSLAERLELETIGEERIGSPLGGTVPATRVRLGKVEASGVVLGTIEALVIDLAAVVGSGDAPVGVLASASFAGRSLVFDFPRRQLSIRDEFLPAANGNDVVEFCEPSGKPSLNVDIDGRRHCAVLDTGSPAVLALPLAAAESLPLEAAPAVVGHARLVGADIDVYGARLEGTLRAGSVSLRRPELTFHETAPHGNLGQGFLQSVELTVDHTNRRLRIRSSEATTGARTGPRVQRMVRSGGGKKRYGIQFMGGIDTEMVVAGVEPGSPAESAGALQGDRILALNDRPLSELEMNERIRALRGSPLRLRVERDGEQHELALSLE